MNKKLITLHPKEKISKAKAIFDEHNIHHIPVAVLDKIIGIVSLGDILFFDKTKNLNCDKFLDTKISYASNIEDIMTSNPICVRSDENISNAIEIMQKNRINCVPVIEENKLIGIITTYDLIHFLKTQIK